MSGNPSSSLGTLNPALGTMVQFDLEADRRGFIGLRVMPVVESDIAGGTYGKITLESLLQTPQVGRSSNGGYNRGSYKFTDENFATKEYGLEQPIDERTAKMYRRFFDQDMLALKLAVDGVLRAAEARYAAAIFNTTTWTGATLTTAVGTPWSTVASAVPITDVEAAVRKVWNGTGIWPNALVIARETFRNLRLNSQVLDRIAANGAGDRIKASDVTAEMLAQVFDLDQVIVAGGAKNTANEGQTRSISPLWSRNMAMVCVVASPGDTIETPCIGRTIHWAEDGSQIGGTVETYDSNEVRGRIVRCRHEVQEKVTYAEMGHLLTGTNGGTD